MSILLILISSRHRCY